MIIVGANRGATQRGKTLRSGSLAIMADNVITATLSEERLTGTKWASGFAICLKHLLERPVAAGEKQLVATDIDLVALSTCCEGVSMAVVDHGFPASISTLAVPHHLSHAAAAYYLSPFDDALVVVADGGGNTLSEDPSPREWWTQPREQVSFFFGHALALEQLERDFDRPNELGPGEFFRAVSIYLGFDGARGAARVMALAGTGRADRVSRTCCFERQSARFASALSGSPYDVIDLIQSLRDSVGARLCEPRSSGGEVLQAHRDLCAYAQSSYERYLIDRVSELAIRTTTRRVCLSGGVALNCVANGRLVTANAVDRAYVPPAPGDEGQAVGNALWASMVSLSPRRRPRPILRSEDAQLGQPWPVNSALVARLLREAGLLDAIAFELRDLPSAIARVLSVGEKVCVFQGRSELGPRALGNRSILADPRSELARDELNRAKARDAFQPFAPAILAESVAGWCDSEIDSPFMSFAVQVGAQKRAQIPSVVHIDGSARLQTLRSDDGSLLRRVVERFADQTGVPLVLNTSFNVGDAAIVETPTHAVHAFARLPVNILVLERFVIIKQLSDILVDWRMLPVSPPEVSIEQNGTVAQVHSRHSVGCIRSIAKRTGAIVVVRSDFPLYGQYLEWLETGRKVTTVRFRKGAVEYPSALVLPMFSTVDFTQKQGGRSTHVAIRAIRYVRFADLTSEDARRDGFDSLPEFREALQTIYRDLDDGEWVTIYSIGLVSPVQD